MANLDSTTNDMCEYRKAIEFYAEKGLNNLLHNAGPEHALIVFENIFKNANSHIRIAAKDLSNVEVVNTKEYIHAMKLFLDKSDSKLDILLTNFNVDVKYISNNNFFNFLYNSCAYKSNRVIIRDSQGKNFKMKDNIIHFCTADSHMYRVEENIEERKARCNFGDESNTRVLESKFDAAFNSIQENVNLSACFS